MHLIVSTSVALGTVGAQNMLSNGSFETFAQCPTQFTQIDFANGWQKFTAGTPDYFNACHAGSLGVPKNAVGFQSAISGVAYAGLATYFPGKPNYREYITTIHPQLHIGEMYEISFSISLSDESKFSTDGWGAYFFDDSPAFINIEDVPNVNNQVEFSGFGIVKDANGWVRLKSYFVADSTYDNIVIGSFKDDTTSIVEQVNGFSSDAYYYIDSIVLKKADILNIVCPDTLICAGDSFLVGSYVHPNLLSLNPTLILQLSDNNGDFANPHIIDTLPKSSGFFKVAIPSNLAIGGNNYRIRIVSAVPSVISADNGFDIAIGTTKPAKPVINSNAPVLLGDTLELGGSCVTPGVTWIWRKHGVQWPMKTIVDTSIQYVSFSDSGLYTLQTKLFGCLSDPDSAIVEVTSTVDVIDATKTSQLFELFPNPNSGEFKVLTSEDGRLRILDIYGREHLSNSISKGMHHISLNNPKLIPYFAWFLTVNGKSQIVQIAICK